MKNKLIDLNDHLFAQLERLGEESLEGDKLKEEAERTKAIVAVSSQIVGNARLAFDVQLAVGDQISRTNLPKMLESN